MRTSSAVLIACSLLFVSGAAGAANTSSAQSQKAPAAPSAHQSEDDVRLLLVHLTEAINAGDAERVSSFWTENGTFIDESGEVTRGKAALKERFASSLHRQENELLQIHPDDLNFPAPNVAILRGDVSGQQNNSREANSSGSNLEQKLQAVENTNSVGWYQAPAPVPGPGQTIQPSPNNPSGMFPSMSKRDAMRIFFEGGSPDSVAPRGYGAVQSAAAPPANNSAATAAAYSNYQTARNEETKSRNFSNTARNDSNKWNRRNAATQAEYAANNAYYAAQRAESAAYNGDSQARSYASLARDAANRARANANRARCNANTIN